MIPKKSSHLLCMALFIGFSVILISPSPAEKPKEMWSPIVQPNQVNLGDSFFADLYSIKRPGDGDDFWHINAKDPRGLIKKYSFDCYTQSFFPNGMAPSRPVIPKTIEELLMKYVCAPPSQIEELIKSHVR